MDSFSEPYTRQGDDISIDQVRADIRLLEAQHTANDIPLSGRVLHVCHYLPITATLNSHPGVLSPPPTPPVHAADVDPDNEQDSYLPSPAWTINPRYGHAAMISGIRSLSSTHEQLIIGWTGDIISPTPGEHITPDSVSTEDREELEEALRTYQPKESDPDDERKTTYVPVWLDDKVAHGHYDGYCKQSES
jgi:trehalose 6-phosphate synthase/phosphatase